LRVDNRQNDRKEPENINQVALTEAAQVPVQEQGRTSPGVLLDTPLPDSTMLSTDRVPAAIPTAPQDCSAAYGESGGGQYLTTSTPSSPGSSPQSPCQSESGDLDVTEPVSTTFTCNRGSISPLATLPGLPSQEQDRTTPTIPLLRQGSSTSKESDTEAGSLEAGTLTTSDAMEIDLPASKEAQESIDDLTPDFIPVAVEVEEDVIAHKLMGVTMTPVTTPTCPIKLSHQAVAGPARPVIETVSDNIGIFAKGQILPISFYIHESDSHAGMVTTLITVC
jgi:hypothetical protein